MTKAEIAEARKVNMAAMVAIARYEGTDFEEEQIKAFQERQRLRPQVAALEARMEAATAASDPATQESLQGVLAEAKEKLEALEAAWREVSSTGWQARVEAAGE